MKDRVDVARVLLRRCPLLAGIPSKVHLKVIWSIDWFNYYLDWAHSTAYSLAEWSTEHASFTPLTGDGGCRCQGPLRVRQHSSDGGRYSQTTPRCGDSGISWRRFGVEEQSDRFAFFISSKFAQMGMSGLDLLPSEHRDRFSRLFAWKRRSPLILLGQRVAETIDCLDNPPALRVLSSHDLLRHTSMFLWEGLPMFQALLTHHASS